MIVDTQSRASSLCALFVIFVFMTVIQESEFLIHSLTEERNELHGRCLPRERSHENANLTASLHGVALCAV